MSYTYALHYLSIRTKDRAADFADLISAAREQPVAIPIPPELINACFVPIERRNAFTVNGCPQFNLGIFAARGDESLHWMPVNTFHIGSVTREQTIDIARSKIPELEGGIIGTGAELQIRWRKTNATDCFSMGNSIVQKLKIRFPVLNAPTLIARDEIMFIVAKTHRPDTKFVRLCNRVRLLVRRIKWVT